MKEPVSLDLFPPEVCPTDFEFASLLASNANLRENLIFYITPLASRNAYARYVLALRSMWARDVLHALGGLGGVW